MFTFRTTIISSFETFFFRVPIPKSELTTTILFATTTLQTPISTYSCFLYIFYPDFFYDLKISTKKNINKIIKKIVLGNYSYTCPFLNQIFFYNGSVYVFKGSIFFFNYDIFF